MSTRQEILERILECKREFYSLASEAKARRAVYNRWVELSYQLIKKSKTLSEDREATLESPPDGSKPERVAFEKWVNDSFKMIARAKNLTEARETWLETPIGSDAEKLALTVMVGFCVTVNEAKEEWQSNSPEGEAGKEFLFKWIENCHSIEEIEEALGKTCHGSTARKVALAKLETIKAREQKERQVNQDV